MIINPRCTLKSLTIILVSWSRFLSFWMQFLTVDLLQWLMRQFFIDLWLFWLTSDSFWLNWPFCNSFLDYLCLFGLDFMGFLWFIEFKAWVWLVLILSRHRLRLFYYVCCLFWPSDPTFTHFFYFYIAKYPD